MSDIFLKPNTVVNSTAENPTHVLSEHFKEQVGFPRFLNELLRGFIIFLETFPQLETLCNYLLKVPQYMVVSLNNLHVKLTADSENLSSKNMQSLKFKVS